MPYCRKCILPAVCTTMILSVRCYLASFYLPASLG
jgi:hypothetical protein